MPGQELKHPRCRHVPRCPSEPGVTCCSCLLLTASELEADKEVLSAGRGCGQQDLFWTLPRHSRLQRLPAPCHQEPGEAEEEQSPLPSRQKEQRGAAWDFLSNLGDPLKHSSSPCQCLLVFYTVKPSFLYIFFELTALKISQLLFSMYRIYSKRKQAVKSSL